jgi:hypothetical protein
MQVIPLDSSPNQKLQVSVSVDTDNIILNLSITYNRMHDYWTMDIADSENVPLVVGLPILSGNYPAANLLEQYAYLEIGSVYIINASSVVLDSPDDVSLGTDFVLVWGDNV